MKNQFLFIVPFLFLGSCKKGSNNPVQITNQDTPPALSYPARFSLTVGRHIVITPVNKGGEVPATVYGQVTTFAGSLELVSGYLNATGTAALFKGPQDLVVDNTGNLYITDYNNNAIRKVIPSGMVSTFAGSLTGISGNKNGADTAALFNNPDGIAIDASGNFFVSDYSNNAIKKITPSGVVTTFYQSTVTLGPGGLCFDNSGNLIVAAQDANQVIKISPAGVSNIVAGSATCTSGYVNGTGTAAQFYTPTDVKTDVAGNIYVADYINNAIRKIATDGSVTTFSGTSASQDSSSTPYLLNTPIGIAFGPGNVMYVAVTGTSNIKRIMPDGTVSLVAGSVTGLQGVTDGSGSQARFFVPAYIFIDNTGTAYVSDLSNQNIRKITLTGYVYQGDKLPSGLTFDATTGIISGTPTDQSATINCIITGFNLKGFSVSHIAITVYP